MIVGAFILTRIARPLLRQTLLVVARRSAQGRLTWWNVRAPRLFAETAETAELRRRQRIDATATGLGRVFSTLASVTAVFIVLQRLNIDLAYVISGAGFLGVALSIGAQHMVNDFATGIHILLEDRFGAGDVVVLRIGEQDVEATVNSLHTFATRFENEDATFHVANRELTTVRNLSQRGIRTDIQLTPGESMSRVALEAKLRSLYANSPGFDAARDGLVLDRVTRSKRGRTVTVRSARSLSASQRSELGERPVEA